MSRVPAESIAIRETRYQNGEFSADSIAKYEDIPRNPTFL